MTRVTGDTLAELNVPVPGYDRRQVTTGIVHIGVGGFHRAHLAMYLDTLMNRGAAMDWGICGIGVQPSNTTMRDALAAQDGLYTLVLRHGDGTWEPRVIGSIVEYLFAPGARAPDRVPGGQPGGLRRSGRRPGVYPGVSCDPDLPARPGCPEDAR